MMTFREYNGFCRSPVLVITLLLLCFDRINSYDLFEGNICHFPNKDVGICRKINECNSIYTGLLDRTVDYGSVVRCSFVRNVEVICCPDGAKEALINMPIDPTEETGNNYPENNVQPTTNRDRSIDKPTQGLSPEIVNSLKDREFIDLAALVNRQTTTTTTTQSPNEYNVQMSRFVPQRPGTNIFNLHHDLGGVEVYNPTIITDDINLQVLGPAQPVYEHNNIMVAPTNNFPSGGTSWPTHITITSNPIDQGHWSNPSNLPMTHSQNINNPNIINDPWNKPVHNSAHSSTQKPFNVPNYVSTQKTLLDPWMADALNTRNRSRPSTESTVNHTPKPPSRTDFNPGIHNNQKPTEKSLLDPWMVNALNSADKQNLKPSTEPSSSVSSNPKPFILSPLHQNHPTTTEMPVFDPWMSDSLNSAHNSARRPSTESSFDISSKRNSTFLNPVQENEYIPTEKSVLDPWMEEALNSADNPHQKPSAESFVSVTLKPKPNVVSTETGRRRISQMTEKSVLDPWMKETLNSAHDSEPNFSSKPPHKTSPIVSTTPKRTILKPVIESFSTTTDNSAFDSWMLEALNSATKPSTERSFTTTYKPQTTILNPVRHSKQISAEQPPLDPWMGVALHSAQNPTSKPSRRTSFPWERPNISQPNRPIEAERATPIRNSVSTTATSVLDPWMKDVLRNTPTSTEKYFHNPGVRGGTTHSVPTKRVKSTPEHAGRNSQSLIFVDTNNVSTSTHLKYSKANNTETRGNGRIAEIACARYSEEAAPLLTFNIINGIPTKPGEFPHMAALGYPFSIGSADIDWKCGGSLISDRFVLTAAHCISKDGPVVVRLGKVTLDTQIDGADAKDYEIIETLRYPEYKTSAHYHDIALLRLNDSVEFGDFIRPACLSTDPNDMKADTIVKVTGWGLISTRTRMKSTVLLKANLTTVPLTSCNSSHMGYGYNRKLQKGLDDGQLCAFDPDLIRDSCEGDSGGPMQTVDTRGVSTIYGITSFGISCASRIPGVYARVSHYLDWIESIVWPQGFV